MAYTFGKASLLKLMVISALLMSMYPCRISGQNIQLADSLALVDLYDKTFGNDWKNNTGWLKGPIFDWYGVGMDAGGKVISLKLPNNGLKGYIPSSIKNLTSLHVMNLSGNEIESIPDEIGSALHTNAVELSNNKLTSLPDFSYVTRSFSLYVNENKLDFGDLEPNAFLPGLHYSNQDSIGNHNYHMVNLNDPMELTIETPGNYNHYQWYKGDQKLEGEDSITLSLENITYDDLGKYYCKVINFILPELTLYSRPFILEAFGNLTGQVTDNLNNPISTGKVELFRIDERISKDYELFIETNGSFSGQVALDEYIIRAVHNDQNSGMIPTYPGNYFYWENAASSILNETQNSESISLIKNTVISEGTYRINGYFDPKFPIIESDLNLILTKKSGDHFLPVSYLSTHKNDDFVFSDLPAGVYQLIIDIPGIPMDFNNSHPFELSGNENLELKVSIGEKIKVVPALVTGVDDASADRDILVYPNPTSEKIRIKAGELPRSHRRQIVLIDINGKKYLETTLTTGDIEIPLNGLKEGMYFILIKDSNQLVRMEKIIIR